MRAFAIGLLGATAIVAAASCGARESAPPVDDDALPADPAPRATAVTPDPRLRVRVDPRVELFSILFRLAGNSEFSDPFPTPYLTAVDRHFAAYARHPAVEASRALRERYGISSNAPVGLAVYLDSAWELVPIRPLQPLPPGLDARWASAPLDDYLAAVRDFAQRTSFRAFFEARRDYLAALQAPLAELLADRDVVGWFDHLFGERPSTTYVVVPGLLTGPNSYAATVERGDGARELYQVLNLQNLDAGGLQHPGVFTADLLVHEIGHAYVNPIVADHADQLVALAEPLFATVEQSMREQAYGNWRTMLNESLVRAARRRGNEPLREARA